MGYYSDIDVMRQEILLLHKEILSFSTRKHPNGDTCVTLYALNNPVAFGIGKNEADATQKLLEKIQSSTEKVPF